MLINKQKNIFTMLLLLFLLSSSCILFSIEFFLIDKIEIDLNNNKQDEIIEFFSDNLYCKEFEPENVFSKIKIANTNNDSLIIYDEDLFIEIDNYTLRKNTLSLNYASVIELSKNNKLIAIQGWPYASNAQKLVLIGLTKENKLVEFFNSEFDLLKVTDLNNNGFKELIGIKWLRCPIDISGIVQEYQPYFVYTFNKITEKFELSESLSINYNENNNDVWAGKDFNPDIVEIHENNKKPYIMDYEEAKAKFLDK